MKRSKNPKFSKCFQIFKMFEALYLEAERDSCSGSSRATREALDAAAPGATARAPSRSVQTPRTLRLRDLR